MSQTMDKPKPEVVRRFGLDFGEDDSGETPVEEQYTPKEMMDRVEKAMESSGTLPATEKRQKAEKKKSKPTTPTIDHKAGKVANEQKAPRKARGRPPKARQVALSCKIHEAHDEMLGAIAGMDFNIVDVVEEALDAFARQVLETKSYKRFPLHEDQLKAVQAVVDRLQKD